LHLPISPLQTRPGKASCWAFWKTTEGIMPVTRIFAPSVLFSRKTVLIGSLFAATVPTKFV
jgi:hypothetical protein